MKINGARFATITRFLREILVLLVVLALAFGAGFFVGRFKSDKYEVVDDASAQDVLSLPGEVEKREVTSEEVSAKLTEIGELASYLGSYEVSKTAKYSRFLLDDIPVPGTTNSITINCEGIVKVGYDINKINPTLDNVSHIIYIALPEPAMLDNYIVWDSVTYSEANNILNPIDFSQYRQMIDELEQLGLEQVEDEGIYAAAEQSIRKIITNFLSAFDEYSVVFI